VIGEANNVTKIKSGVGLSVKTEGKWFVLIELERCHDKHHADHPNPLDEKFPSACPACEGFTGNGDRIETYHAFQTLDEVKQWIEGK